MTSTTSFPFLSPHKKKVQLFLEQTYSRGQCLLAYEVQLGRCNVPTPKTMACSRVHRDIYDRRHASSCVLTGVSAGRIAIPNLSTESNVIRRTNGPVSRGCSRCSRKYGGPPLSVGIRSGEFADSCGDLTWQRSAIGRGCSGFGNLCRLAVRVMGHWVARNVEELLVPVLLETPVRV